MPQQRLLPVLAVSMVASASALAADTGLTVRFIHPETYTDAAYDSAFASPKQRAEVQRDIERHLQRLAADGLPAGQTLQVEVLDVDLAGQVEPIGLNRQEVRVLRPSTWPRIDLHYRLSRGGEVLAEGDAHLQDMDYQTTVSPHTRGERLSPEKALLDRWFSQVTAGK